MTTKISGQICHIVVFLGLVNASSAQSTKVNRGPLVSLPFARGEKIFTNRKAPSGGVDFCVQDGPNGEPKVVLSAEEAPLNEKFPIIDYSISDDGRLCSYFVLQSNPKYEAIRVVDLQSGKKFDDVVSWTHYSDFAWRGSGFYYGAYQEPAADSTGYSDERLMFHRLGTPQSQDILVFKDPEHPKRKYLFLTTYDHRFLFLHILERAYGEVVSSEWFRREGALREKFKPIQGEFAQGRFFLCDNLGDRQIIYTKYKAPAGKVIEIDARHPEEANWKTLVPEPVEEADPLLGKLLVVRTTPGGGNQASICSMGGKTEAVIPSEPGSTIDVQFCSKREKYAFASVEKAGVKNYYRYDLKTNRLIPFE